MKRKIFSHRRHPGFNEGMLSSFRVSELYKYIYVAVVVAFFGLMFMSPDSLNINSSVQAASQFVNFEKDVFSKAAKAKNKLAKGETKALLHLTDLDVLSVFGTPEFVKQDGDISIWQYKSAACIVDIFFYDSAIKNSEVSVIYYTVRGHHEARMVNASFESDELLEENNKDDRSNCIKSYF